jgi:hypothetical protein
LLLESLEKVHLVACGNVSLLNLQMDECTKLPFLAVLSFLVEMLARISLILLRMIKSLEGCVRVLALIVTTCTSFRVIVFALFRLIVYLIRRSSEIEGLVSIHTMVPIMILGFVCTEGCLVSVNVENGWIYGFQV